MKQATNDFLEEMLPKTRKELFYDIMKLHFLSFLKMGFILFLFSLPLLFLWVLKDVYVMNLTAQLSAITDETKKAQLIADIYGISNTTAFLSIFALLILFIGLSGIARVIRQYAWMENVFFAHDFVKGIRQNISSCLLFGFLFGAICALLTFLFHVSMYENIRSITLLFAILLGISIFLIFPLFAYTLICIPIYGHRLKKNFQLGLILYIKSPLKTLFVLLCCSAFYCLYFIPNFYCHLFVFIIGVFLFPFVFLIFTLFSYRQLDMFINPTTHPELINKGLYQKAENKKIEESQINEEEQSCKDDKA